MGPCSYVLAVRILWPQVDYCNSEKVYSYECKILHQLNSVDGRWNAYWAALDKQIFQYNKRRIEVDALKNSERENRNIAGYERRGRTVSNHLSDEYGD